MTYLKIVFIVFCFFSSPIFATTVKCPTLNDIHHGQFGDWLPLYQANEELASDEAVSEFKKQASAFKMAVWDKFYLESGHCYYQGSNKIVLAQDAFRPDENESWQWIKPNQRAECEWQKCGFTK